MSSNIQVDEREVTRACTGVLEEKYGREDVAQRCIRHVAGIPGTFRNLFEHRSSLKKRAELTCVFVKGYYTLRWRKSSTQRLYSATLAKLGRATVE